MRRSVSGAYVIRGLGDMGLGLVNSSVTGSVLLFVYGINTSTGMVSFQTVVQREVPAEVRARAFATLDVVWQVGRLTSIAVGAAIVTRIGIRALFIVGGALLVLAGILGVVSLSEVRRRSD